MDDYLQFETDRLLLRPTVVEDAPFVLELLNTPSWLQYIGDRNVHTLQDAKNYIKQKIHPQLHKLGYSNYTVIRKADSVKLGSCGLYDREGLDGIDIGFAFFPRFERMGYAFESAQCLLDAAFNHFNIKEIRAITTQENIPSQKLLIKLGLSFSELVTIPNDNEQLMLYKIHAPK